MKIFKSLALVAGMAFVTAHISAQAPAAAPPAPVQGVHGAPDPDQMAQRQTAQVKQNVTGITSDQESQILAANQDYAKGVVAARSNNNGDKSAIHSQIQSLREARDAKYKTILTADQYAQYQKAEAAHMGGHKGGEGNQ